MTQPLGAPTTVLAPPDAVLRVLIAASVVLVLLALICAAGVLFLHVRNERRARQFGAREGAWQPQLLEILATGDVTAGSLQVHQKERAHFLDVLTRFAARLRGEERALLVQVAQPYLGVALERRMHRRPEVRARAVRSLALLGLPQYGEQVVEAMDDASPLVSMTAARGLARRELPEYAASILARLPRFEHWDPSYLAAMIASLGPEAAPELRIALGNRAADATLRAIAANALASLRDLAAADLAAEVLNSEPPAELAAACLRVLGSVGRSEHLETARAFLSDPSSTVRGQAIDATAALGGPADVTDLQAALTDESPWVGLRAARGLRLLGQDGWLREIGAGDDRSAALAREALAERVA